MAFYKQDIVDINLNTGNIYRSFLNHAIGYKNDDADRFGIRTFRDGEPVDLTGVSCQAVFMAPDGSNIALTSYGTVSGNVAYVTLPPACYNYEGQFCLSIQLVGGGVTGTMRIVDGMVVNTGASGTVAPTSSVPTYQEIIAQYDAMVAGTAAVNNAIDDLNDIKKSLAGPADSYSTTNNFYLYLSKALSTSKTYLLAVKVGTSGTYTIQTSTVPTGSGIVDTLATYQEMTANVPVYFTYKPSAANVQYIRISSDSIAWYVDVSEIIDGVEFSSLKSAIDLLDVPTEITGIAYAQGNISSIDGSSTSSTTRCRSGFIEIDEDARYLKVDVPTGKKLYIYRYTTNSVSDFAGAYTSGWATGTVIVSGCPGQYIKLVIAFANDTTITTNDLTGLAVYNVFLTDSTLTESKKPADAKSTGDKFSEVDSALETLSTEYTSVDFDWTLKMVIASNGEVTANNGYALSGYIPVEKGCIVTNKSDSIGMDDDPTYFYVAEFNNGVFDVRTPVNSGEKAKLKDTTNSIRICFGYVTLSGNTITTEDLGQHFKCEMLQRALTDKLAVSAVL